MKRHEVKADPDTEKRQKSLRAILPRAIADAVKGNVEIAVINSPIHVDEHDEGEHVYAPRVAIEGGVIYRKFPNIKWAIDAMVSPTGRVFYTQLDDVLTLGLTRDEKHA